MLEIHDVSRPFGGVFAVRSVSMTVPSGELRGVIGPNGAGKSTLFGLISGHLRSTTGSITLDGSRIDRLSPQERARRRVATVFQGARIFPRMSVLENVMVGGHARTNAGIAAAVLRTPHHHAEERELRESASAAIERVGLGDWAGREASELPLGQQRRMQVARALAGEPSLLLLDEPASGLRVDEREALGTLLSQLRSDGMTIMLVEHDVSLVARLADTITVLDLGEVIAEGTPDAIRADPRVIEAYLGTEADHA